jgi:two-component system KDP operon response regulator KdpE
MIPGLDGLSLCRAVRNGRLNHDVPILMLTARREEADKVVGLESGADDYLTKPFGPAELMARLGVALRHSTRSGPDAFGAVVTCADLRIDLARRLVVVRGNEVHLTPIEYKLLAALAKHAGMVLTQNQLLREVWGPSAGHQSPSLRVHMAQLRRKLEEDSARPRYLVTEPGVGYRLKVDKASPGET